MNYFSHHTVDTQHNYVSNRSEVLDSVIQQMKNWVAQCINGQTINIYDNYSCELLEYNNKLAHFQISINDAGVEYDVLKFVICLHSRTKAKALKIVEEKNQKIDTPFIAVRFINTEYVDIALADFERCIAWGFYEYIQENKNAVS